MYSIANKYRSWAAMSVEHSIVNRYLTDIEEYKLEMHISQCNQ